MEQSHDYIREIALWDSLNTLLRQIADIIEHHDDIAIERWEPIPNRPRVKVTKSPAVAIQKMKELEYETLWKASILAGALPDTLLRDDILTNLGMCRDAIGQADVPAEIAQLDGFNDEAIKICERAIARACDRCGPSILKNLATPKRLKTSRVEWTEVDYVAAVGMSRSDFLTIKPLELEPLVALWQQASGDGSGYSPPLNRPEFIKLRTRNGILENSTSELMRAKKELHAIEEPGSNWRRFRIPLNELRSRQWTYPSEWNPPAN